MWHHLRSEPPDLVPRICEVNREDIASPAASSVAELILTPEDSRSMAWLITRWFWVKAFAVNVAAILVLIVVIVFISPFA